MLIFLPIILLDYSQKCSLLFSCILLIILILCYIIKLVYWLTIAIGLLNKRQTALRNE